MRKQIRFDSMMMMMLGLVWREQEREGEKNGKVAKQNTTKHTKIIKVNPSCKENKTKPCSTMANTANSINRTNASRQGCPLQGAKTNGLHL